MSSWEETIAFPKGSLRWLVGDSEEKRERLLGHNNRCLTQKRETECADKRMAGFEFRVKIKQDSNVNTRAISKTDMIRREDEFQEKIFSSFSSDDRSMQRKLHCDCVHLTWKKERSGEKESSSFRSMLPTFIEKEAIRAWERETSK
ncbi:hypothetical protein D8B26_000683 [Coccidioides posadasii str. Silveira]|uniref:uncharacterized protein n=1 Tax=Coccidioides posadasii (strain RMSCC 757 / Silveira) TaxID=443226 RepID=UPI001BEF95DA|nr:hypothetical protein D8B26_000683 [Coccidioides posadasii str. Silveira]